MSWGSAKDAAWRAFGKRYWRLIVGLHITGKVLPVLLVGLGAAAAVWGVWWLIGAVRAGSGGIGWPRVPGWLWWTAAGLAVSALLVWWVRRDPYRLPWRYRKAQVARRFAAVLAAVGLAVAVVLWRA